MTATAPVVSYLPAGCVPPNEKVGVQFQLDMINEALDFHQNGDDVDPACCTAADPCRTREGLEEVRARISGQVRTATTDPAATTPDPQQTSQTDPARSGRRAVADPATDRQIGLINRLVQERDTARIGTFPARTLAEIRAGSEVSRTRASGLITALMGARQISAGPAPTPAQIRMIETMAAEQDREVPADLTRQAASALITDLMKVRAEVRTPDLEVGMYQTPDGDLYKVQESRESGKLYAKKLVRLDTPRELKGGKVRTHEFAYEAGAIRKLTADMRMTLEQAKRWGQRYGTCCVCGATLINSTSIEEGVGPVCGGRV